jgi:hypothetical protein
MYRRTYGTLFFSYITFLFGGGRDPPPLVLLLAEGLTIGALIHSGVGFVGAHQNAVQRAIVLSVAVVCARLDGAFNALVGMTIHSNLLLLS